MNWISDERGSFIEALYLSEYDKGGQISILKINPGKTRGNHYHTRKIEAFVLLEGDALFYRQEHNNRSTLEITNMKIGEEVRVYTNQVHKIYSEHGATLLIYCTEKFNKEDPDTYPEEVYLWN